MPLYLFECNNKKCKFNFEYLQNGYEEQNIKCPKCGKSCKHLVGKSSFILKGNCWARDGYSSNPSTPTEIGKTPSTTMRVPMYADRNTGKSLGNGKPQVLIDK